MILVLSPLNTVHAFSRSVTVSQHGVIQQADYSRYFRGHTCLSSETTIIYQSLYWPPYAVLFRPRDILSQSCSVFWIVTSRFTRKKTCQHDTRFVDPCCSTEGYMLICGCKYMTFSLVQLSLTQLLIKVEVW